MMSTAAQNQIGINSLPSHLASKRLYFGLLENPDAFAIKRNSIDFIDRFIVSTLSEPSLLPEGLNQLEVWLENHNHAIGRSYREYLDGRKAGKPRQFFKSKSHALYFIRAVAPTKLVDGSWLYGITKYWQDQRLSSLLKIYLEELGDGKESMNHVVIYKQLLRLNECEDWHDLPEAFFTQGAIQLSLANNAPDYLPEIIGFNLAYEQLPLHLLITAYELKELNIDPYYFTLHTTIDNAQTGHAQGAVQAVKDAMPVFGDQHEFINRVVNGAKLNDAGPGTLEIIAAFDLQDELIRILQNKATLGQHMHSDRLVLKGLTINQWLSDPTCIPELLELMQENGWINRHCDPENSRFWKAISGDRAPMFGVFTSYERQVVYDWIAGDCLDSLPRLEKLGKPLRLQQPRLTEVKAVASEAVKLKNIYEINPNKSADVMPINKELDNFEIYANSIKDANKRASLFIEWMSPSRHHTPVGLLATRKFRSLLYAHFN